eukprot:RCo039804
MLASIATRRLARVLPLWLSRGYAAAAAGPQITVHFITKKGKVTLPAEVGKSLMEVARANDIDIEAACDGTCACSTCHVYVQKDYFEKLPKPTEDELDMLDLALDLKETSRLSCQIKLTKEMDGLVVSLPAESLNHYSGKN